MGAAPASRLAACGGWALALCAGALLAMPGVADAAKGGRVTESAQPNIILITTDDQSLSSYNELTMPETTELFWGSGTTFTNAIATTPLCCPSRASMLSGQYAHNHGILANAPGYPVLRQKRNVLPVWLKRAGYRTAHLGKWLHHYIDYTGSAQEVAPGWDYWLTLLPLNRYYKYDLQYYSREEQESEGILGEPPYAEPESHGRGPNQHLTTVLSDRTIELIEEWAPRTRPFYIQLDQFAPHTGKGDPGRCHRSAVPEPRHEFQFLDTPLPANPNFNEQDVSDKPSFIRELPELSFEDAERMRVKYGCALAALRGVDRGVARIDKVLGRTGERNNTAIIFMSDNGYFYGEHRLRNGKSSPYEEAIHLPMAIKLPRKFLGDARQPATVSSPVANIDLAPTILELAGGPPCRNVFSCRVLDGRSLVQLARGNLDEYPADRELLVELDFGASIPYKGPCQYAGIRYAQELFVHYTRARLNGGGCQAIEEYESYRLDGDPYELENAAGPETLPEPDGSGDQEQWQPYLDRVAELQKCAGIAGRDPQPASGVYCD